MPAKRTTTTRKVRAKGATKKGRAASPRAKTKTPPKRRSPSSSATSRPTLATVSAQLEALRAELAALTELVRAQAERHASPLHASTDDGAEATADRAGFDVDLLGVVAELDRTARHAGMVPIPEIRKVFLERGWSRSAFDERLLQAERDFIVDLKSANDPARLDEPDLAIQQPGRGFLQYVVTR